VTAQQPQTISLQAEAGNFPGVTEKSVARQQEDARTKISYLIVGSLAFIVLATFFTIWSHTTKFKTVDDLVKIIQAVLGPVAGIVGAVAGFYFGARQGQQTPANSPQ